MKTYLKQSLTAASATVDEARLIRVYQEIDFYIKIYFVTKKSRIEHFYISEIKLMVFSNISAQISCAYLI